jgi:hypothetical protein
MLVYPVGLAGHELAGSPMPWVGTSRGLRRWEPVHLVTNCGVAENGILICACLVHSKRNADSEWHISANRFLFEID